MQKNVFYLSGLFLFVALLIFGGNFPARALTPIPLDPQEPVFDSSEHIPQLDSPREKISLDRQSHIPMGGFRVGQFIDTFQEISAPDDFCVYSDVQGKYTVN